MTSRADERMIVLCELGKPAKHPHPEGNTGWGCLLRVAALCTVPVTDCSVDAEL